MTALLDPKKEKSVELIPKYITHEISLTKVKEKMMFE